MRHILFDLDGTLIDSAPSILKSFAAALKANGLRPRVALDSGIIGPPLLQTLRHITGIEDPARLAVLAEAFKAHYDEAGYRETVVYPGVAEVLARLRRRDDRLYIVTNKRIAPTRRILDHLGWSDCFAGVYAQDAFVPAMTSKAAVIAAVLQSHAIVSADAAYVGDRQEDGEAAVANRLRFIWVKWGYGVELDATLYRAEDAIVAPDQLLSLCA